MKIPFVAATTLVAYNLKAELGAEVLKKAGEILQKHIDSGSWREVKLVLRFLGGLQPLFEGDGIFPLLEELFARAVDLQTASSEDVSRLCPQVERSKLTIGLQLLGLELVKVILFTIPYVMSSPATGFETQAMGLLEKTDIIASTPHALVDLVNTFSPEENKEAAGPSVISLLQSQLQGEASRAGS